MNYLQHNKELHGALYKPEEPVIFTKADSALLKNGKPFFVPDWASRVDYEAEVVVRICRLGKGIPVRFAHRYYDAVTVGIDFTARDWQQRAREKGLPWTICKGNTEPTLPPRHRRKDRSTGQHRRYALHGGRADSIRLEVLHPAHRRPAFHRNTGRRGACNYRQPPRRMAGRQKGIGLLL